MKASRGEIKIFEILTEAGLNFQEEYIFPDLVSSSRPPFVLILQSLTIMES